MTAVALRAKLAGVLASRAAIADAHAELIRALPSGEVSPEDARASDELLAEEADLARQIARLEHQIEAVEKGIS